MLPSLLALLSAAAVSAEFLKTATCAGNTIEDLVERTACGSTKDIADCLRIDADIYQLGEIEECFKLGGCGLADAIVGAAWIARECHEVALEDVGELKRRGLKRADATTVEETTASAAKAKTLARKAAAATTTESSTTATSTAATSTDSTTALTTGKLLCSTTVTSSTTACSVSAGKTITCFPTTTAISSCAPGNICFTSTAGADICMKKDDSLTTSGLAVTIAFAVIVVGSFAGLIIVQLRNNSKNKKLAAQKLMLASSMKMNDGGEGGHAGGAHTSFGAMGRSDADLPLINSPGPRGDGQYYGEGDDLGSSGAPRLHPGLGALGQERY